MTKLSANAHRLFANQHGVASRTQLAETGLSQRQVQMLAETGQLINVERDAYATPSRTLDELGRCAALCLARPDLTIAGPTAGRIWGFRHVSGDKRIHVIAPPRAQPSIAKHVEVYRTAAIHDDDVIDRSDGIRVTSRARTAFDLARHLVPDDVLSVVEQAMSDGNLTDADMRRVAVDWISPQRPWVFMFLHQLDRRLDGSAAESRPEVDVGQALRSAGVIGLERQHRVDLPGYGSARFDLAVPEIRWAIEIDVFPTHEEIIGAASDHRRDVAAGAIGWSVSRITRQRYESHFDHVIADLVTTYRTLR